MSAWDLVTAALGQLGAGVRSVRERRGLHIRRVAKKVDIDVDRLLRVEHGTLWISQPTFDSLLTQLKADADEWVALKGLYNEISPILTTKKASSPERKLRTLLLHYRERASLSADKVADVLKVNIQVLCRVR
jgi:transcriptional regulator with XRE-family HTH domain